MHIVCGPKNSKALGALGQFFTMRKNEVFFFPDDADNIHRDKCYQVCSSYNTSMVKTHTVQLPPLHTEETVVYFASIIRTHSWCNNNSLEHQMFTAVFDDCSWYHVK